MAESGAAPCITFHVGSQCLSPFSYAQAVEMARRTAQMAGVEIAALDMGGGFPGPYPGNDVPPYHWYFDTIREALATFGPAHPPVLCEPGRALIAEGMSLITQVILRKGESLYLNDGVYGSFDELTLPGWTAHYQHKVWSLDSKNRVVAVPGENRPFRVYGPTCDTLDVLPYPLQLPTASPPATSSSSRTWAPIPSPSAPPSTASSRIPGRWWEIETGFTFPSWGGLVRNAQIPTKP